jgi:hypothetical protein
VRKDHHFIIALFLIPVYLLSMLNLIWPDQLVSESENRALQQLPVLSIESLVNGKFTLDFEAFFTDQFPFRQFFIDVHQQTLELLKAPFSGDIVVITRPGEDDIGNGETLKPDPSDIVINPTETTNGTDPAVTSGEPTAPVETTTPQPSATPTPITGEVENFSSVIIVNDYAMELFYFSESRVNRFASLVNQMKQKLPDVRVFDLVAPTSVEFHSPEKYHSGSSSQKMAISYLYSQLSDGIITVNAYDKLAPHVDEYLYFRTDHHWTARGAYYAYTAFCESAGLQPVDINGLEHGTVPGDFLGSLYRYTGSSRLKNNPDHVEYFMPTVSSEGVAYKDASMSEGYKVQAVRTEVSSSNKYLAFIGGDSAISHFKTTLTNGKSIMVLKESYGNAFVPYLLNHYEDVYVADPRNLEVDLPAFITKQQIQDLLIINYSFGMTNAKWVGGFEDMIG